MDELDVERVLRPLFADWMQKNFASKPTLALKSRPRS